MHVLPFALAIAYLAINLGFVVWIAREEVRGTTPARWLLVIARILRYVPPLIGLLYLVTIAGDWPFFLFVVGFFAFAFFLLDRSLGFPSQPRKR
jgi:hypothetical protein